MTEEGVSKEKVKSDFEDLKEHAKRYKIKEIKSGEWFAHFLRYAFSKYAEKVNAEYFKEKYPHFPMDAIIDRRIELARKYAAIEGSISASVYSGAIAATIGSHGGSSPVTIPAAALSFTADLLYTTRLQLHLAYDISVLYEQPIDIEDPEDLYDLVRIAFGVKAGEMLREAVGKAAPEAVRQGVKTIIKGATLQWLKKLPIIGKYLLQRNIIKFSIPFLAIPLSAGINYWSTGAIARTARQIYRDKAGIKEKSRGIVESDIDQFLLLQTIWMVVFADKKVTAEESWLMNRITKDLKLIGEDEFAVKKFSELINLDEDKFLKKLGKLNSENANAIYDVACYTAAVDHKVNKREHKSLRKIASACKAEYSKEKLNSYIKQGLV